MIQNCTNDGADPQGGLRGGAKMGKLVILLYMTSSLKLIDGIEPNLAGSIPLLLGFKIVQMMGLTPGCWELKYWG